MFKLVPYIFSIKATTISLHELISNDWHSGKCCHLQFHGKYIFSKSLLHIYLPPAPAPLYFHFDSKFPHNDILCSWTSVLKYCFYKNPAVMANCYIKLLIPRPRAHRVLRGEIIFKYLHFFA